MTDPRARTLGELTARLPSAIHGASPRLLAPGFLAGLLAVGFVFLELPGDRRFWHALQNAGHGLAFALLTVSVLYAAGRAASARHRALALAATFALGVAVELAQHLTGRGASAGDIVMNLAGIVAGASFVVALRPHRSRSLVTEDGPHSGRSTALRRILAALLGVSALLWCLRWPIHVLAVDALAPDLPLLATFEQPLSLAKLGGGYTPARLTLVEDDPRWPENTTRLLVADFPSGLWPGFRLVEPPFDWHGYTSIAFRVVNPGTRVVRLYVRVDQRAVVEDAFWSASVDIEPGMNEVEIALGSMRPVIPLPDAPDHEPFTDVSQVMFFLAHSKRKVTLLFDDVSLR